MWRQSVYWSAFRAYIENHSRIINPTKALPQHWLTFAVGRTNFLLVTIANTRDNRIEVSLQIGGPVAKTFFYLLRERQDEIEKGVGEALDWRELPDKTESHIYLSKEHEDPTDKSRWDEQHAWLLKKMEKFDATFRPIVKTLNADGWTGGNSEEGTAE